MYASAQLLDFLARTKNTSFPNWNPEVSHPEFPDGHYLEMVTLLGKRIGGLHHALEAGPEKPALSPEPYSTLYQRSVYRPMRSLALKVITNLDRNIDLLDPETGQVANESCLPSRKSFSGCECSPTHKKELL